MDPSAHARKLAFRVIGIFFGVAALYHLGAIFAPSFAGGASQVRHWMFVAINLLVALGLMLRQRWVFWFFTALTLQQLHSHGSTLLRSWADAHRIDWQSVLVLVVVPLTWTLLFFERRKQTSRSGPVS